MTLGIHDWRGSWSSKKGPACSRCKVTLKDWLRCEPVKRPETFPEAAGCMGWPAVVSDA